MVVEHRKSQQDEEDGVPGENIPQLNDKKHKHKDNDDEGFTRSISLYWHWVRCQRAAARLGKVGPRYIVLETTQNIVGKRHPMLNIGHMRLPFYV